MKHRKKKSSDASGAGEIPLRGFSVTRGEEADPKRELERLRREKSDLERENELLRSTRRRLEDALDQYANLYDFAPLGYVTFDAFGVIQKMNLAGAKMLGQRRGELVGRSFMDRLDHSQRAAFHDHLRDVLDGADNPVCELAWRKGDDTRYLRLSSSAEQLSSGDVLCRTAISEITDRVEMERKLHDSSEELRKLFHAVEQNPTSIVITDREGSIEYVNPAFTRFTGYTLAEAVGQNPRILNSGQHPQQFYKQLWDTVLAGEVWRGDIVNRRKNGEIYHELMSVSPIRDERGRITHFIAMKVDDTERKLAEEMLRASEERLSLALHGGDLGLWDWDVVTGEVYFNERYATMLGYAQEEMDPNFEGWHSRVHPEDLPSVMERLEDHIHNRSDRYDVEFRLRHKEGHWVWIHSRGRVVKRDEEGRALRFAGTHMDITWRKQAEREKSRMQERMEKHQRLESLGVLAGGIAHDFNNLLASIIGHADLLKQNMGSERKQTRYVNQIIGAADRAAELTNQMLAYAGRGQYQVEPLDMNRLLREMRPGLAAEAGDAIALELDLDKGLTPVRMDRTQLEKVIRNLVSNAVEAIGDRPGRVALRTEVTVLPDQEEGEAGTGTVAAAGQVARLAVEDDGAGMDEATRQRIFEPFFSTHFTGRGLGMSAVLGIVRAHHGAVHVQSEPGVGTRVTVDIPVAQNESVQSTGVGVGSRGFTTDSLTILVAEDEPSVLSATRRMLEYLGHRVIAARDGREALERFQEVESEVDALLLDYDMPGMNGLEVLDRVRAMGHSELPVVLASGYSREEAEQRHGSGGYQGYLRKPFRIRDLARAFGASLAVEGREGVA